MDHDGDEHGDLAPREKKEKNKNPSGLRQRYHDRPFCFGDQDTIESVITFRIDSRTIKRDEIRLWNAVIKVPLDVLTLCICI
jgi:hypothetical protein